MGAGEFELGRGVPWITREIPSCHGAFRQNTRVVLRKCGEPAEVNGRWPWRAWVLPLNSDFGDFFLHVFEEKFQGTTGVSCEQCRCNGWQHHPVSSRKYHFILPAECVKTLPLPVLDSKSVVSGSVLEAKSHILHGVVHGNGFGHLMRINGFEGGSRMLSGRQVMTLWDELCSLLRVRCVSIEDVSNRKGMLLRVLTPVAEQTTWYGRWGYGFGRGGYNIRERDWLGAIDVAQRACLDKLVQEFSGVDDTVVEIIQRYRGSGDDYVSTVGEWLKRVVHLSTNDLRALEFALQQTLLETEWKRCRKAEAAKGSVTITSQLTQPAANGAGRSNAEDIDSLSRKNVHVTVDGRVGASPSGLGGPSTPVSKIEQVDLLSSGTKEENGVELGGESCFAMAVRASVHCNGNATERSTAHLCKSLGTDEKPMCNGGGVDQPVIDCHNLEAGSRSASVENSPAKTDQKSDVLGFSQGMEDNGFQEPLKKSIKRKYEMEEHPITPEPVPVPARKESTAVDRGSGRRARKVHPTDPPGDLINPVVKVFNPQTLLEGPRKYSASKLSEFMRIVLGVLQTVEGRWVRLQELREHLYATAHDRVLADWVLGRISNTIFGGFVIYKTRSKIGRCNYFRFQKVDSDDRPTSLFAGALSHMDASSLERAPGPVEVAGCSLERFEPFLSEMYTWLCSQPGVVVGRGPNKKKVKENCPPGQDKRRKSRVGGGDSLNRELRLLESDGLGFAMHKDSVTRGRKRNAAPGEGHSKRQKMEAASVHHRRGASRLPEKTDPWVHQYVSLVQPSLTLLSSRGTCPGAPLSVRNQILTDLLYFYQNVLECYKPAVHGFARNHRPCSKEFPRAIQILKDTKLFVKDYEPVHMNKRLPGAADGGKFIRMLCRVELEPTNPPGHPHRLSNGSNLRLPSFFSRHPPAEPVLVSEKVTMQEIKLEIHKTFRNVYLMFQDWEICNVDGLEFRDNRLVQPHHEVRVTGRSYQMEPELRHAGGIEDWEVFCSCQTEDDDGARMVACDECGVWMHTRCIGFRDDEDVPEFFRCPDCARKFRHRDSL